MSHGQSALVQSLLDSFDKYLKSKNHDIYIVVTENDRPEFDVKSKLFTVTKISNLRKKGFGANHNANFENFESDIFFIVNPDILLHKEFDLDKIVEQLTRDKIDISSPEILNPDGGIEDYKRANLSFLNICKRIIFKDNIESFDWFAGMFLIVKSEAFTKLRGFDINFFMYVEDCDLSMRARKARMKLGDVEGFSVTHDARRASTKSFRHLKWHVSSLFRYWFLN